MISPAMLHYGSIAFTVGVSSFSVSIGESLAMISALSAITRQPHMRAEIMRTHMLGAALIEGAAIFSILVVILLIGWAPLGIVHYSTAICEVGICVAMSLTCGVLGIVSGFPVVSACFSLARQPFMSQKIISLMIITQALIQTPLISALMIVFCIKFQMNDLISFYDSFRLFSAGTIIGLGTLGPAIGLSLCAKSAIKTIGMSRKQYNKILSFTLISQAIIETPVIFSLITSLLILFLIKPIQETEHIKIIMLLGATICAGLGTFATGISSGNVAKKAVQEMGMYPDSADQIVRTSFLAQGIIETGAIYSILISFILLFFS